MRGAASVNPQLIIAAVIASLGFGSAWKLQDWRYGAKEKERVEQTLRATQDAAKTAIRRADNIIDAQNASAHRLIALRRDAAASRDALNGVSLAAGEALRTATASHDACIASATAASQLLVAVSAERRELAEKADGHVNDIKTLMQARPK